METKYYNDRYNVYRGERKVLKATKRFFTGLTVGDWSGFSFGLIGTVLLAVGL